MNNSAVGLRTDDLRARANREMLKRLKASALAAEAFAGIMQGAAQTHAKRLKKAAPAFVRKLKDAVAINGEQASAEVMALAVHAR